MSALEPRDDDRAAPPADSPGGPPPTAGPEALPPAGPQPAGSPAAGSLPLWAVGAAVCAGSLVVLVLMGRPATHNESAARDRSSPATPSAVAPARAEARTREGWTSQHSSRWTGGRPRSMAFELEATDSVKVWMNRVRPVLVVRCLASRTDAFVYTDAPASIEPDPDTRTVRVGFNGQAPVVEHWVSSSGHDGLFAPDGKAFTSRLAAADSLAFGFTPQNAAPVVATFDLAGIDHVVEQVSAACRKR